MLWDAMLGEVYAMVPNTVISPTLLANPWFYDILMKKNCNQLLHISINKECQVGLSTKNTGPTLSLLLFVRVNSDMLSRTKLLNQIVYNLNVYFSCFFTPGPLLPWKVLIFGGRNHYSS